MAGKFIPGLHPIAKAARGWPSSPKTRPTIPIKLNRSHPLAKYCTGAFIGGDNPPVNHATHTPIDPILDLAAVIDHRGYVTGTATSREGIHTNDMPNGVNGADAISLVARLKSKSLSNCFGGFGIHDYGTNNVRLGLIVYQDDLYTATGGSSSLVSAGGMTTNNWHDCALCWDKNDNGGFSNWYLDGNTGNAQDRDVSLPTTFDIFALAGYGYGSNRHGQNAETEYGFIFSKKLTATEVALVHADPYALYEPANSTPFLVGVPAAGGGAYTLEVTAGALTLTGGTVTPAKGSKLNVTAGALSLTGGTITASAGKRLAVTAGSLSLTGGTVTAAKDSKLAVTAGALGLTGQTVTLTYTPVGAYDLTVLPGELALNGQSITFTRTYALQVTAGSLGLTGQTITMDYAVPSAYTLEVTAGELALTGQTITATHSGAVTLADVYTLLEEIHAILGLTAGSPMTVTPTSRVAGSISQTISGDGTTSTTVTRDP